MIEHAKQVGLVLAAQTCGLLDSASDDHTLGLACAWVNYSRLQRHWCNCVHEHGEVYFDSLDGKHGWMCDNCHGITQTG